MSARGFLLLGLLLLLMAAGCTDVDRTVHTLLSSGYQNIQITGYEPWGCGQGDSYSTGFIATNPTGQRVTGVVCCGLIKSCTVRF